MRHHIEYQVDSKIKDDLPYFRIEIFYEDDFTDDSYLLQSNATNNLGTQNIPFIIYKNERPIGKLEMTERDTSGFFETMFADTSDADFKTEFYSKVYKPLSAEISKFFKYYDELVIDNGITVEGDVERMKTLSGIK